MGTEAKKRHTACKGAVDKTTDTSNELADLLSKGPVDKTTDTSNELADLLSKTPASVLLSTLRKSNPKVHHRRKVIS